MAEENIYDMSLHGIIAIDQGSTRIQRVPGGWIYTYLEYRYCDDQWGNDRSYYQPFSVFVPYNNEFDQVLKGGE